MPAFRWWTELHIPAVPLFRAPGRLLSVALLLLFCLPGRSALAMSEDACIKDDKCKDHYSKAVKLYKEESYDEALTEFQAAYEARAMPLLLVNIGRALQKLGRPKDALSFYERFLQAEAKADPDIKKRVEDYIVQVRALIGPGASKSTGDAAGQPQKPLPEPPPPGRKLLIAGSVLAAVGVAGIAVSIGLGAVSSQQYGVFQNPNTVDEFDKRTAIASAQSYYNGALAAGILGAALVASGGALVGVGARTNSRYRKSQAEKAAPGAVPAQPPRALLVPLLGGGALVVQGGF